MKVSYLLLLSVLLLLLSSCTEENSGSMDVGVPVGVSTSTLAEGEEGIQTVQASAATRDVNNTADAIDELNVHSAGSRNISSSEDLSSPNKGITPVFISIPSIKVEAEVIALGLLDDGQMDSPGEDDAAGWFEPGFKPGEKGNSVIAGHRDSFTGPALFFRLNKVKVGDKIIVADDTGEELTFIVSRIETYDRESSPMEQIFGVSDKPQLNLITCAGRYDRSIQESEERLVIYSEIFEL